MQEQTQGAPLTGRTMQSSDEHAGRLEGMRQNTTDRIIGRRLTFALEHLKTFVGLHHAVESPLHILCQANEGFTLFKFWHFIFSPCDPSCPTTHLEASRQASRISALVIGWGL
jgi:hypothetical protein